MKDQDPFNPAMPADFKLLAQGAAAEPAPQTAGNGADPAAGAQQAKRKSTHSEKRASGSRTKRKCRISWPRMKEKLNAKLAGLDKEKLKTVLVACGIAAGVVVAVIAAVKLVPIAVLLLAALGLAAVIKIWDRLRRMPEPVC